jgi:Na+/H+-dicarboxylate symporter
VLDMCRTAVNVCGDLAATAVVSKSEGALDESVYNDASPKMRVSA